jgi:hypothetical protein
MKHQIVSFSVKQSSKVLALLYGVTGLIFVPIGILIAYYDRDRVFGTGLVITYLCSPIIYLVIGYIVGLLGFWVYNFIAKRTGGIEFELKDIQ